MHNFFLTDKDIIKDNQIIIKSHDLIHQLSNVLRVGVDYHLNLLPNNGLSHLCQIIEITRRSISCSILSTTSPTTEVDFKFTLAQSLLKNLDRFEFALQKAIEMGYTEIIPLITDRTQRIPRNKFNRWQKIIIEASEQSGRAIIPKLHAPIKLPDLLKHNTQFIIPDPSSNSSIREIELSDNLTICIGPEGGFSDAELAQFQEMKHNLINLGPRILRSETANIAIASLINNYKFYE